MRRNPGTVQKYQMSASKQWVQRRYTRLEASRIETAWKHTVPKQCHRDSMAGVRP